MKVRHNKAVRAASLRRLYAAILVVAMIIAGVYLALGGRTLVVSLGLSLLTLTYCSAQLFIKMFGKAVATPEELEARAKIRETLGAA